MCKEEQETDGITSDDVSDQKSTKPSSQSKPLSTSEDILRLGVASHAKEIAGQADAVRFAKEIGMLSKQQRDAIAPFIAQAKQGEKISSSIIHSTTKLWDSALHRSFKQLNEAAAASPTTSAVHNEQSNSSKSAVKKLESKIGELRDELSAERERLQEALADGKGFAAQAEKYADSLAALQDRERIRHLVDRVGSEAREHLLAGGALVDFFACESAVNAFVMSIDLRQSTVLMLKAREPRLFAQFLHQLAKLLREVIVGNGGVFDKFTGDGVLAFFPEHFSGPDAGLLAVDAACKAHEAFAKAYRDSRSMFDTVLLDIGLGIGIDWGQVTMVSLESEFTVVGRPVVFACRLGGAPANTTLVNQPAYEVLLERHSEHLEFDESQVDVKHEGATLAYGVRRNSRQFEVAMPTWLGSHEACSDPSSLESDDTPE